MDNQRQLSRISLRRRGFLRHDGATTLCELHDLTEKGMQLATEVPLSTGKTLALEFQLVDHVVIHCTLLVTHAEGLLAGGRIVEISPEHQEALTSVLNQMMADRAGTTEE